MRLRSLFTPSSRTPALPSSIQRRQFYRLPLDAPTLLRDARRADSAWEVARIANLSGGGVLLAASAELAPDTPIRVRVPSGPQGTSLEVKAVVIESAPQEGAEGEAWWIRARFPRCALPARSGSGRNCSVHSRPSAGFVAGAA